MMRFVDEYRDGGAARKLADAIARAVTRPWTIMEVCGGQTHTIVKYGIDEVLPAGVELVAQAAAVRCASRQRRRSIGPTPSPTRGPASLFCSFGDMLRVPGSRGDLLQVKAQGGDVRVVYSPLDAVNIAAANPEREVVFFAIGFETTAAAQRDGGLAGAGSCSG